MDQTASPVATESSVQADVKVEEEKKKLSDFWSAKSKPKPKDAAKRKGRGKPTETTKPTTEENTTGWVELQAPPPILPKKALEAMERKEKPPLPPKEEPVSFSWGQAPAKPKAKPQGAQGKGGGPRQPGQAQRETIINDKAFPSLSAATKPEQPSQSAEAGPGVSALLMPSAPAVRKDDNYYQLAFGGAATAPDEAQPKHKPQPQQKPQQKQPQPQPQKQKQAQAQPQPQKQKPQQKQPQPQPSEGKPPPESEAVLPTKAQAPTQQQANKRQAPQAQRKPKSKAKTKEEEEVEKLIKDLGLEDKPKSSSRKKGGRNK
jgi:hypothetical protein